MKKVLYQELASGDYYNSGNRKTRDVKLLHLVEELEQLGYAEKFRLGLCMFGIILSRSAERGLREDQHHILIGITNDLFYSFGYCDENASYFEGNYTTHTTTDLLHYPIFLKQIEDLLARPIN